MYERLIIANKNKRILIAKDKKRPLGFFSHIEKETLKNDNFRKVINTSKNSQLVLMSLKPHEDIGNEVHHVDQFFRFESGEGKVILNDGEEVFRIHDGDSVTVPAGTKHNVINTSDTKDLKLYTIYSPPEHKPGDIKKTKKEATEAEENRRKLNAH